MILKTANVNRKSMLLALLSWLFLAPAIGQNSYNKDLKLTTDYSSLSPELRDILQFEEIEYMKLKFTGEELKDKSYHITVKEFWDGKMVSDTTVFNSAEMGIEQFEHVNDTALAITVISKLTPENKLKMQFKFPRFSFIKEYDAIETDDYSLRSIAEESGMEIGYDEKFYFLAYILPYELEDGSKSWCEVGANGKDIENWGEKFGIKHYLLFEMNFE